MTELVVDAGVPGAEVRDLFPLPGEYCVAMAGLCRQPTAGTIPDVVFLELYAYELVERSRELRGAGGRWRVPFWPASVFAAADLPVHAGRELARMLPSFDAIVLVPRDRDTTARTAVAVFGELRFDPESYYDHARSALEGRR